MKILLIDTPFSAQEMGGGKGGFAGLTNIIPSLGPAYLAAVAEKAGHDVRILDCSVGLGWEDVSNEARAFAPDVVGVNAATPTFLNAVRVVGELRRILPEAVYLVGGAHATAMPAETLKTGVFDFVVVGEGERTFVELLEHLEGRSSTPVEEIAGLAFQRDGEPLVTPRREYIRDLDVIPLPARHLLPPLKAYSPTPASYRKLPLAHIMTSRGCPMRCAFCDRAVFGGRYRERSADNVLAEVEEVVCKYGAREIRFFDDCFTITRKRLAEICKGIKNIRPRLPWTCLTSVKAVDLDMLKMMRDAGCWQILFGLESGDDGLLKTLGKGNTVEQNRRAVLWARRAGLRVRADFIVGTPHETVETLTKTVAFAKSLPLDFAHFNKFVPFPGTAFYEQLTRDGYHFDFSRSSINDHDALVFVPQAIPADVYHDFLNRAFKGFYLRPGYLLRRLVGMRTFTEFLAHLKGFFTIRSLSGGDSTP